MEWHIKGKKVLITGATSGIGFAASLELLSLGADVCIVSRDTSRCKAARDLISEKTGAEVGCYTADLSSLRQIRHFAERFISEHDGVDVLINNVGAIFKHRIESEDDIEMTFALNHLGHFLLTDLLLPLVKKNAPSRIINVSSAAHWFGRMHFDDLQFIKRYSPQSIFAIKTRKYPIHTRACRKT